EAGAKEQQRKWNDYYAKVAADYQVTRGKDQAQKLELKPEAVLYWSNPIRPGETNGSVFVWTYDGRAALVGTIFSHLVQGKTDLKVVAHEFQSLTPEPLAGSRPGAPGRWWEAASSPSRFLARRRPQRPRPDGCRRCGTWPANSPPPRSWRKSIRTCGS